eukprot:gnl/TRDRNA2_/TRDRNA2_131697_c0_seq3.p1 gnl/TRDRNA2_/TRDRNA2_131697_c0~~gnl/TRDRNA2_/TRDRNA2_131697_c0_seq3.p1  ORF type:complete len:403 (+),score=70.66 gnl/TRDRNA2_/TRDRNA2_131697_c0_seq3:59-1267(+)
MVEDLPPPPRKIPFPDAGKPLAGAPGQWRGKSPGPVPHTPRPPAGPNSSRGRPPHVPRGSSGPDALTPRPDALTPRPGSLTQGAHRPSVPSEERRSLPASHGGLLSSNEACEHVRKAQLEFDAELSSRCERQEQEIEELRKRVRELEAQATRGMGAPLSARGATKWPPEPDLPNTSMEVAEMAAQLEAMHVEVGEKTRELRKSQESIRQLQSEVKIQANLAEQYREEVKTLEDQLARAKSTQQRAEDERCIVEWQLRNAEQKRPPSRITRSSRPSSRPGSASNSKAAQAWMGGNVCGGTDTAVKGSSQGFSDVSTSASSRVSTAYNAPGLQSQNSDRPRTSQGIISLPPGIEVHDEDSDDDDDDASSDASACEEHLTPPVIGPDQIWGRPPSSRGVPGVALS